MKTALAIVCGCLALASIAAVNVVPTGSGTSSTVVFSNATATGWVRLSDGSASVPSLSFTSDPDTGFYSSTPGIANLTVDATRVMAFSSSQLGGMSTYKFGWYSPSFAAFDTFMERSAAGTIKATTNLTVSGSYNSTASLTGTNMPTLAGRVTLAATAQTYIVTNSLVTANSIVLAVINSDDTTALNVKAIPGSGILTLKANAAANANCTISYWIITP